MRIFSKIHYGNPFLRRVTRSLKSSFARQTRRRFGTPVFGVVTGRTLLSIAPLQLGNHTHPRKMRSGCLPPKKHRTPNALWLKLNLKLTLAAAGFVLGLLVSIPVNVLVDGQAAKAHWFGGGIPAVTASATTRLAYHLWADSEKSVRARSHLDPVTLGVAEPLNSELLIPAHARLMLGERLLRRRLYPQTY